MRIFVYIIIVGLSLASCIKDDFIDDSTESFIRITNTTDSLLINDTYQFEFIYLNNVGQNEAVDPIWSSGNTDIAEIDDAGLVLAKSLGNTDIIVSYETDDGTFLSDTTSIIISDIAPIDEPSLRSTTGTIETTTFYLLEGTFEFNETETGVEIIIADDYQASTGLPGFYVYLSNNKNSIANAFEISKVDVFSGAHSYVIDDVGFLDYQYIIYYCKPFNVKIGEAQL